jgi:ubiquitin C-terminal hydrolase
MQIKENYGLIKMIKKNNVFKRLKKSDKKNCPGIGLKDTGETSIMNIILQCFVHIKKFLKFLNIILKLLKAIEQQNYINLLKQ